MTKERKVRRVVLGEGYVSWLHGQAFVTRVVDNYFVMPAHLTLDFAEKLRNVKYEGKMIRLIAEVLPLKRRKK